MRLTFPSSARFLVSASPRWDTTPGHHRAPLPHLRVPAGHLKARPWSVVLNRGVCLKEVGRTWGAPDGVPECSPLCRNPRSSTVFIVEMTPST